MTKIQFSFSNFGQMEQTNQWKFLLAYFGYDISCYEQSFVSSVSALNWFTVFPVLDKVPSSLLWKEEDEKVDITQ